MFALEAPAPAAMSDGRERRLAGNVAHELNDILTSVMGNTRLVEEALAADSDSAGLVRNVLVANERAAYLAFQLQSYAGTTFPTRRSMHPPVEARAIVELLDGTLPDRVRLRFEAEPRCPWIEADPAHVRQILMALIRNEADACQPRGTIHVGVGLCVVGKRYRGTFVGPPVPPGRYAWIEVRDSGNGMDARVRDRAFEPFFTTRSASRGMGLPMVRGLVETYGGGLELRSTPGEGTAARVLLPGVKLQPDSDLPVVDTPARILVMHPDAQLRRALARSLHDAGHLVMPVPDAASARRAVRSASEPWDAVLVDTAAGLEPAEQAMVHVRRGDPGIAVIMLGVSPSGAVRARLTYRGVDGFLPTSPTTTELTRMLYDVLGSGTTSRPS